jgi:hypothetical protein
MEEGKKVETKEAEKSGRQNWVQILIGLLILILLIIQLFII